MIIIKDLVKIYRAKKASRHKALDNINLTLPDKGLVFVLGKSGSGKSTLLNLIGGLDDITSGTIEVDGNNLSKFKEKEYCNYRNNHIGFIFQDYHLIEEMTVLENIALSLNLKRIEDLSLISKALEKVGLAGYEARYPSELSGGERQRVAIARAVVKEPHIILADEPTGNLDDVTATSIVELLKEISKNCLILIVSHNTFDTYKYADRIIKLSYGKIISDESRNKDYFDEVKYIDNNMYYPMDKTLTKENINELNERIKTNSIKEVKYIEDKYLETTNIDCSNEFVKINDKTLSAKNVLKLTMTFLKAKTLLILLYSFIVAAITVILSFSLTIIAFDSSEVIKNELEKENQETLFVDKINGEVNIYNINQQYYERLSEDVIQSFVKNNLTTKVYPVISSTVPVTTDTGSMGIYHAYISRTGLNETFGTLCVDEEFFNRRIGKLEYTAKLDEFNPGGVLITDYVADMILLNAPLHRGKGKVHEDLLGYYAHSVATTKNAYINGIIKTDYQEKHGELLEKVLKSKDKDLQDIYETKEYLSFLGDLYEYLGYSYTLNPDFLEYSSNNPVNGYLPTYSLVFNNKIPAYFTNGNYAFLSTNQNLKYELVDNEVTMNYDKFNQVFKTDYTTTTLKDFTPIEVTITQYNNYDYEYKKPLNEIKIKITKLHTNAAVFIASEEVYKKLASNAYGYQGIYFDGLDDIENIMAECEKNKFTYRSYLVEGISTMTRAVEVFVPIFEMVGLVICVGVIGILISFSTKMIKDKYHEIGILKALGCKNSTISVIFGLQLLLIMVLTIIMSILGYLLFIGEANNVLVSSLKELAPNRVVLDLEFLTFKPMIALINSLLIVVLTVVSFVIPMLSIYNIKPVKIIKSKE